MLATIGIIHNGDKSYNQNTATNTNVAQNPDMVSVITRITVRKCTIKDKLPITPGIFSMNANATLQNRDRTHPLRSNLG